MNKNIKNKNVKKIVPKRLLMGMISLLCVLVLLLLRIAYLQFIQGPELRESANRQQSTDRIISPKRGNIYDSTGKLLAASAQVDTVSISPSKIDSENKETIAKALSDIFELNYEDVLKKVNSVSKTETIIKKVEKDKIDELKKWMENSKLYSGINIDEDVKRYYPYGNLASNLIGFCNTDNIGQEGIELKWNNVLSGTAGKIVSVEDAWRGLIPDANESYVPAENGNDITLTIDANIQTIAEKYLKQACLENQCNNGGTVVIMNPKNGDVLAMATYPDYDLNSPRTPNDNLLGNWDKLSDTDKMNSLYKMWRNKAISDTYEPGSTFKIITAAIGLEENVVETDVPGTFYCSGYEMINGTKINCWRNASTHGSQTLRKALMNSCNPALMQLGKKIGASTLYKYYKAFGLFDKTGIATSGETNSVFWDFNNVGNVELATMSFGQRFKITPIQLITAISSVANGGVLVQPRLVKEVKNTDNGSVTTIPSTNVRQVISKETADKMMDMLESVVTNGTGHYAQIKGYSIAGKTGTTNDYRDAWFVGYTPDIVTGVWVGNDNNSKLPGITGGSLPARVFAQYMKTATESFPKSMFNYTIFS